jgi:carboxyl-terminal processing protease
MIHRSTRRRLASWLPAVLALLPAAVAAQDIGPLDRDRGRAMLRQVRAQIEQHYYDPGFGGVDLDARTAQLDSVIQEATLLGQVLAAVAALPAALDDSHTFFIPPRQTVEVEYGWEMMMVGDSAFVWRVDEESDAWRQGVRPGDRVLAVNGFEPRRADLWQMMFVFQVIRPQPLLRVALRAPGGEARQMVLASRVRRRPRIVDTSGAGGGMDLYQLIREAQNEADELASIVVDIGDVAVWKFPTFDTDDRLPREAMRRVRGKRALVVDLRGNGGGAISVMLEAIGAFFADSVTVGREHGRSRSVPMAAPGAGARAFTGQVVVLVDSRSSSAAEIFARTLQLRGRATVVGDRTAGAVRVSQFRSMRTGVQTVVMFGVSVTESALEMADGASLEGVGVAPDAVLLPTAADLAAGADAVLAHALRLVGVPMDPAAAGALYEEP